ncbi:murein hydrolase activator EnvC family protein [Microbacterium sp. LWH12-1.2]|uniref:murein hydrolase activator EnvC family protein n=1 Tax=Microbacterium sp. LWH12-1.2 TaxID=3135259 RepID=UPI00341367F2
MYAPHHRRMAIGIVLTLLLLAAPAAGAETKSDPDDLPTWNWPLEAPREVVVPYRAPAHDYGAGHRGVDIAAARGGEVRSPADGVVAFRGTVVDRPLLTIDHGGGLVSTFEPLLSTLSPGDAVAAGDVIGVADIGGHARPGSLHLGVRLDGEYINPMLLFGAVPRAVLLPCCAPL